MEAEAINQLNNTLSDLESRSADIRVYLDYAGKKERLEEVVGLSEDPELWNDPKKAQEIGTIEILDEQGFLKLIEGKR